eukprot:scaffold23280_cov21-Tisochrysis_lutea.AAC.3
MQAHSNAKTKRGIAVHVEHVGSMRVEELVDMQACETCLCEREGLVEMQRAPAVARKGQMCTAGARLSREERGQSGGHGTKPWSMHKASGGPLSNITLCVTHNT